MDIFSDIKKILYGDGWLSEENCCQRRYQIEKILSQVAAIDDDPGDLVVSVIKNVVNPEKKKWGEVRYTGARSVNLPPDSSWSTDWLTVKGLSPSKVVTTFNPEDHPIVLAYSSNRANWYLVVSNQIPRETVKLLPNILSDNLEAEKFFLLLIQNIVGESPDSDEQSCCKKMKNLHTMIQRLGSSKAEPYNPFLHTAEWHMYRDLSNPNPNVLRQTYKYATWRNEAMLRGKTKPRSAPRK